jgi:hypothetical protein
LYRLPPGPRCRRATVGHRSGGTGPSRGWPRWPSRTAASGPAAPRSCASAGSSWLGPAAGPAARPVVQRRPQQHGDDDRVVEDSPPPARAALHQDGIQ